MTQAILSEAIASSWNYRLDYYKLETKILQKILFYWTLPLHKYLD